MNKRILELLENWTAENIRETSGDTAAKVKAERMAILFLDHARMAGISDIEIEAATQDIDVAAYIRQAIETSKNSV